MPGLDVTGNLVLECLLPGMTAALERVRLQPFLVRRLVERVRFYPGFIVILERVRLDPGRVRGRGASPPSRRGLR